MNTVTLGFSSMDETKARMAAAFRGEEVGAFISFASVQLLWKVITDKRLQILDVMKGRGGMTIRQVATGVDRDKKAVHGDIQALLKAGILDHDDAGRVIFPYDAVHVDFMLVPSQRG